MNREITIHVRLDAKTFRRFCRFDGLWMRRRWARPLVFALLLGAFAAVALLSGREQSGLIAGVLLAVGLGLPLVYIGSFLTQINRQVKRYGLKSPRAVYTVRLSPDAMRVTNDQHIPLRRPRPGLPAARRPGRRRRGRGLGISERPHGRQVPRQALNGGTTDQHKAGIGQL